MQASIESIGNLERRLSFSLPEERLQSHIAGRLGEIARTTRIKGFRPGKVPAKVIEQRFGAQVRGEALDGLLRETFDAAVREHDLRVVGSPRIDKGDEGEFSFVATVEVVPDFGDIDVSKLTVVRHTAEITDADIDQMIENLQNQRRTWAPVSRGAQDGDLVAVETWSQAGEERLPAEGTEKGSIVLGQGMMFDTIEKGLVGLLVGEVARINDLRLEAKRLNETMRLIASTYEEPEQVIEMYRNDPQLMSGLQNRVMEEQVIDWIAERAQHTEEKLSFQDAIRQ